MLELQVPFHPRKKSSVLIPCKNLCRLGKSPWQLSKPAVLGMEPWLMACVFITREQSGSFGGSVPTLAAAEEEKRGRTPGFSCLRPGVSFVTTVES